MTKNVLAAVLALAAGHAALAADPAETVSRGGRPRVRRRDHL